MRNYTCIYRFTVKNSLSHLLLTRQILKDLTEFCCLTASKHHVLTKKIGTFCPHVATLVAETIGCLVV